jgi:hypothetical protein
MSNNKPHSSHPSHIYRPHNDYLKSDNEAERHKSLLDMGESFLTYLVGIMFGEYKRSGEISDKLETEFYKYSSRKPSFGVFLSFMRILSNEMNQTILSDKFEKGKKYAAVSDFIFHFNVLKTVINEGCDDGFDAAVEPILKGRTAGQNGLMDFFDTFIMIRNIYAHPDEKAGPKDNKRKWPLGDDYYEYINPHMNAALSELVEDFEILKSYKPILAKLLDDKNKKGTFLVEQGGKDSELQLELSKEDLNFMNTDLRYLLDPDDNLFVKLYYHAIPQLNPEVAKKIIDREKAKAMEPHMEEMIHNKLIDDEKIDDMEYLVLRDTAKTSSISDERLFQLIDKVKNKLGIKGSVGTPDNKGDIFIEEKHTTSAPKFNPWWLNYLAMVKNIDKKIPKAEKQQADLAKRNIGKEKKIKKTLPEYEKLDMIKKKLKEKRAQKASQIKKMNDRAASKRDMREKASIPERKATLLDDINSIKESIEEKRTYFDAQIEEMLAKIEGLEEEKQQKLKEVDDKIQIIKDEDAKAGKYRQWTMHKRLWTDIGTYINYIVDSNLNSHLEGEDEESKEWEIEPNQWQQGNLTYDYWAKIYPSASSLKHAFHIGFSVSRDWKKWIGPVQHPEVREKINQPCIKMWPSIDLKYAAKIDPDCILLKEYKRLIRTMMEQNLDLLKKVGANIQCIRKENNKVDTVPLNYYLDNKNIFDVTINDPKYSSIENKEKFNLYSKIWTLDDFMDKGSISHDQIASLDKNLPVYMTLIANIIKKLNDYALEKGINKEVIRGRLDRASRLGETMNFGKII